MLQIPIDGSTWKSIDDVYDGVLPALKAPDWHGRNLDALWDSLSGDDLNGVRAPFELIVKTSSSWPSEVSALVSKIEDQFRDAKASGSDIKLTLVRSSDV